jgi:DNA mismatch repair protein MutL
MPRILQLSSDVVTKIAAGEVIERPSSVVKELLENSIDAGATRIEIDLEQGGTELIRIVDDGCGIVADDLPLAFASHATSKLATADDLFDIRTLGFRGEALASIGSIAHVTLQSWPTGANRGHEIRCEGHKLSEVRPWGGSPGTRIEVRHLFYNVPVRKKFLKGIGTELGHVTETVTKLALANPALHLVLRHNGKSVYDIPASANLKDRIGLFFGAEIRDSLYAVESGPGQVSLTGYIADPKCDRGNAKLQYLFLNGRWFRDRSLGHGFQEAYRGLLMTGRYAVGFLYLKVPPNSVDVNVHPTKAEVRFRENSLIYSLVRSSVKNRLMQENLIPQLRLPEQEQEPARDFRDYLPPPQWSLQPPEAPLPQGLFSPRREAAEQTQAPWETMDRGERMMQASSPSQAESSSPLGSGVGEPEMAPAELASLPALAAGSALQLHDSYIVLETAEGMLVIDQHALHERILFEQLRRRIRDGKLEVQRLLIPEPIDLPAEQAATVLEFREQLSELGLDVSDFGGNTILLSSYPTMLSRRPPFEILQGVIDYLVSKDRAPSKEILLDHLLATMACKAAVKAGDRLTQEEIAYLLELRKLADDSHHCPHGRPTTLLFSRKQLDKQFGRT